jgi:HK97 family phage major capsid protein
MFDYTKYEDAIEEKRGRAKHLVDTAVTEKREMTESERREYDSLYGEISATRALVDEMKDQELDELRKKIDAEKADAPKPTGSMSDEFRAMPTGETYHDIEHRAWTTSSGASATLAQEWHDQMLSVAFEESIAFKSGIESFSTASTHNIPLMTAYGSGTAVIVSEGADYTKDDPTISNVQWGAYKFVKRVDVTEELLEDSQYDVAGWLARAAGVAYGRAWDRYFVSASGTGTSTPSGILSHSGTSSGAGASGITVEELIAFSYTLPRHYRNGACWYMNDDMVGYIAALRTTASATEGFFWNDPVGGEPAKLGGYPIYTCSDIASKATASAKVIAFANPKYYMVGFRGPFGTKRLQLSEHSDTFAFRQRADGHPLTASAIKVFLTSTT